MSQRDLISDLLSSVWTIRTGRFVGHGCDRVYELPLINGPEVDGPIEVVPMAEVDRWKQQSWDDAQTIMRLEEQLREAHGMLGLYAIAAPAEVHEAVREKHRQHKAEAAAIRARANSVALDESLARTEEDR